MSEPLFILAFIAILLGAVMLVGHGLWVLLTALLRMAFGQPLGRQDRVRCQFCGRLVAKGSERCDWCNHSMYPPLDEEIADIEAVERHLRRLREAGLLKPSTATRLSTRLARYRRDRIAQSSASQAPAGPAPQHSPEPPPPLAAIAPHVRRTDETPADGNVVEAELVPETPESSHDWPQPAPAAKPWQEVLAGFLADREIHWAELIGVLVGGFIMVGSSVALVVNLWQTLEQIPYLKFFVLVAYTSLVFAAGLYAFYRWKLQSTGGGLLVIGMLLVPLNFLAMASLWRAGLGSGAVVAEAAGLAVFLVLVRLAAGVLTPEGRWFAPLGIAGNSAAVLAVARFVHAGQPPWLVAAMAYVPVAVFAVAMGGYLLRAARKPNLRVSDATALLILLGTVGFALCVPVGLHLTQATAGLDSLAAALNLLAVPASLAAVPILAVGVRVMRTLQPGASEGGAGSGSFAAVGTLVALLAILLQIAALGLAWPEPRAIVAVGLFNAAGLLLVAFRHRFPVAHAGAMACLALSYLVGFHWAVGNLDGIATGELGAELLKLAVAAQSGTALGGLFAAFALASLLLKWLATRGQESFSISAGPSSRNRQHSLADTEADPRPRALESVQHGEAYAAGSAVVAVIGLMLVTYHGLISGGADAFRAAALYAVYGAGSLALAALWRNRQFATLGTPLAAAVPLWALWASTGELAPIAATLLAAEALAAAVLAFMLERAAGSADSGRGEARRNENRGDTLSLADVFQRPLIHVAEVLAVLAAALWVVTAWTHRATIDGVLPPVATVAALAVFYFAGAWIHGARWRVWAGSMVVLAGLTHTLALNFTGALDEPWLMAPLIHATAGLLGALTIDGFARWQSRGRRRRFLALADPLADSALLASILLLPILPFVWQTDWTFAGGLFWLAAIWLVFAVRSGNAAVFSAHQAVLGAATMVATTVWLDSLLPNLADEWFKPACLQAYAIALAAVMLPWPVLRVLTQRLPVKPVLRRTSVWRNWNDLLDVHPSVDRVLRHTLVAVQFLVAALWLAPELAREMGLPVGPTADGVQDVSARGAWLVATLLAAGLLVELWHRWGRAELLGAIALAGTVPWLLAARAVDHVAVASALRWAAAGLFLGASALVWWRDGLSRMANAASVRWHGTGGARPALIPPAGVARGALLVFGLLPVVVLTIVAVALRFDYVTPRGPLVESAFFAMGSQWNRLLPLGLLAIAMVGSALRERSAGYAVASILLASLAGLVTWQAWGAVSWHGLLLAQVFTMTGAALFWTAVKMLLPARTPPLVPGEFELAPNHLAAQAAAAFVLLLVAASALGDISGEYHLAITRLDAFGLLAAVAAVVFCLWDPAARFPIAAVYLLGLSAVGFALGYREFGPRQYVWTAAPELAGFVISAGFLGWLFSRLQSRIAGRVVPAAKAAEFTHAQHAPHPEPPLGYKRFLPTIVARLTDAASQPRLWFQGCQAFLGTVAAAHALWVSFDIGNDGLGLDTALFGLTGRWAGPPTALMLLGACIIMAWQASGTRRRLWQMAAFGAGFLLNLTIGLAALDATPGTPVGNALWLNRLAVLLIGAAMLTLLSRFGLKGALPRSGDWLVVGRDVSPLFATITTVTLPALLMGEFLAFDPVAGAPVATFSVIATAVLLVLLAAACLVYALRAARLDAARRSEPAPTLYVYAAEAIVALAALHLWLCEPQWFRLGFVEQYWMFLVMAVAFAGVGVSEWFHRAGLPVLSEPLRNTVTALPVVPMAGFWFMAPPQSLLGLTGSTPALWLLMALFYGYLAAMKPSSVLFGALTLFTGSVGLWVLLDRQQLDFFTHPQLWLIPPALAMLVAERLNRTRLGHRECEALRYVGLSVIYIASTTEFMRGIGQSIWLPLVLLGLSVAGVLVGVALRIRSYIYLGMTFLAVVMVRMIVYAAFEQGQMWLFWVCCILLGAAIIFLFAAFERRRADIAAAADKFRQWER